jgi:hypothetical protein
VVHLSPKASVDAAYRTAGAHPTSFHLSEAVNTTVNGTDYGGDTVSGDVYSDPSNPSASYASLSENISILGKSAGNSQTLLKNEKLYINDGGIHGANFNVTSGWKAMSLTTYAQQMHNAKSGDVSPLVNGGNQSSVLGALLGSAKITASGSSEVGGQAVNVYTATAPYAKLIPAMAKAKGQMALGLGAVMSLYHMTGNATVTIETTKSTDQLADVNAVFSSTFSVKGSSTKYHTSISVQQQYTNYGVKFSVTTPASAKTATSFNGL